MSCGPGSTTSPSASPAQMSWPSWEAELARRGITFTPAAETPIGTVVVFRDPDEVQLEFWLPV